MIQRIQSIFLLLAAISVAVLFFMPMGTFMSELDIAKLSIFGLQSTIPGSTFEYDISGGASYLPIILTIFAVIIPIITIFLYKKRTLQLKLCRMESLLLAIIICDLSFFYVDKFVKSFESVSGEYYWIIPVAISIIFTMMAYYNINKDIKLLRSADRLR